MTKLRIMSDLHNEFAPLDLKPIGEDILVLAGDIGIYTDGAVWARDYARRHGVPVVMIAGNHEFYRAGKHRSHTLTSTITALREVAASEPLLTFLEDDIEEVNGVVFTGSTLWTDFNLNGNQSADARAAVDAMNDYNCIWRDEMRRITSDDVFVRHVFSEGILRERLPRRCLDGKPLIVVTHHLPSARSLDGRYADSQYNAAYASNLDDLVENSGAAIFIHGHTHVSKDYMIGTTRVICNPRGYAGYELNPDFNVDLIVEV